MKEKWKRLVDEMKHLGSGYGEPEADIILWADRRLSLAEAVVEAARELKKQHEAYSKYGVNDSIVNPSRMFAALRAYSAATKEGG